MVRRKTLQKGKFLTVQLNGLAASGAMSALIIDPGEPMEKLPLKILTVPELRPCKKLRSK